jgi:type IV secretory pathway component VirB8
MVELTQTFKENTQAARKYNRYMFWVATFMASIAVLQLILILTPFIV